MPGAGDSAKSRLTRKMWSAMELDPYAPRDGQDVQAIRSAAAETLLKVALGFSSPLDSKEVRSIRRDLERALAGGCEGRQTGGGARAHDVVHVRCSGIHWHWGLLGPKAQGPSPSISILDAFRPS